MSEPGTPPVVGIIGGSGLYEIDGLTGAAWQPVASPWGAPSDEILTGYVDEQKCCFLPRHGRGHPLSPSDLNSRANIDAFKRLGVTEVISLSACGSLTETLPPGTFVIVDSSSTARTAGRAASLAPAWWRMWAWAIRSAGAWAMRSRKPPMVSAFRSSAAEPMWSSRGLSSRRLPNPISIGRGDAM